MTDAATRRDAQVLTYVSPATVRREALKQDARILDARGLTHAAIALALGVSRPTVGRWLA